MHQAKGEILALKWKLRRRADRQLISQSTNYGRTMKPFSLKSQTFGQINFGAVGVFLAELSAPILVQWVPVSVFYYQTHFFYKKLSFCIHIQNIHLGLGILPSCVCSPCPRASLVFGQLQNLMRNERENWKGKYPRNLQFSQDLLKVAFFSESTSLFLMYHICQIIFLKLNFFN